MKIVKVLNGGKIVKSHEVQNEIALDVFIEMLKEEHEKQYYDINVDLELDEDKYNDAWNKKYNETLNKCIEYAKISKENSFGDYKIVLLDENDKINENFFGSYTFYDYCRR